MTGEWARVTVGNGGGYGCAWRFVAGVTLRGGMLGVPLLELLSWCSPPPSPGAPMNADDVLTLAQAAEIAGRATPTLRRWIKKGDLPATLGPAPRSGGRQPFIIRAGDLFQYLSNMGVNPSQSANAHKPPQGTVSTATATATAANRSVEVAALQFEVERTKLTSQAETARLRLAHGIERVNDLERQLSRALMDVSRLQSEVDDWKERHDAREAEVRALRAAMDVPWYRRLLGGPVAAIEGEA